jgi:hypothetical protein
VARSPNDLARDIAATGADVRPGQERIRAGDEPEMQAAAAGYAGGWFTGAPGWYPRGRGSPHGKGPPPNGCSAHIGASATAGALVLSVDQRGISRLGPGKDGPAVARNLRLQDASPPRCTGDASSPFVSQTRSGGWPRIAAPSRAAGLGQHEGDTRHVDVGLDQRRRGGRRLEPACRALVAAAMPFEHDEHAGVEPLSRSGVPQPGMGSVTH